MVIEFASALAESFIELPVRLERASIRESATPNQSLERTSEKLRFSVPSRLRRSAAAQLER